LTRRHVRINLLDKLICLLDARRGGEQRTLSKFRMEEAWNVPQFALSVPRQYQ
jgi:hypothetical protein